MKEPCRYWTWPGIPFQALWVLLTVGIFLGGRLTVNAQLPISVPTDSATAASPAMDAAVDSTLVLEMASRRVGLTTFSQRSDWRGRLPGGNVGGRGLVRYHVSTDWLASTAAGEDFFVRQETRAVVTGRRVLGATGQWAVEPFVQHAQNPSIRMAISTAGARTGWHGRLPGVPLTDSVSNVTVGVLVAGRRDSRRQYTDLGPTAGVDLLLTWLPPGLPAGSSPVRLYARTLQATLGPRTFNRTMAESSWEWTGAAPGGLTSVRVGAEWRQGRTEDYLSGNIQRIRSDTLSGRLALVYPLNRYVTIRSDNMLALPARQFAYRPVPAGGESGAARLRNSSYNQRDVQLRQEVRGRWRRLRGGVQFGYTERQRAYAVQSGRLDSSATQLTTAARQEQLKDTRERTTAWLTDAEWAPLPRRPDGVRHTLSARTTAQLLRLDTPSDQNNQDRDEVYYQGRAQWATQWDPTFRTAIALAGEWRQFVFIKASQSAENYIERIVGYEPSFQWVPGRFSWKGDFQLRSLYQVRALTSEQGRNRATRLLRWEQEWSWRLPTHAAWLLTATYQRRESRFSVLDWDSFSESPLDTTVANDYLVAIRRALPTRANRPADLTHAVRVGYRFFEQRVHQRSALNVTGQAPQLIFRRDFTWQHGPEVRYERALPARGLRLTAAVWLQRISTFRRYKPGQGTYAGTSFVPEDFPNRATRTDPYFDILLTWRWR